MEQEWFEDMEDLFERDGIELSPCQPGKGKCYMREEKGQRREVGPEQVHEVFEI